MGGCCGSMKITDEKLNGALKPTSAPYTNGKSAPENGNAANGNAVEPKMTAMKVQGVECSEYTIALSEFKATNLEDATFDLSTIQPSITVTSYEEDIKLQTSITNEMLTENLALERQEISNGDEAVNKFVILPNFYEDPKITDKIKIQPIKEVEDASEVREIPRAQIKEDTITLSNDSQVYSSPQENSNQSHTPPIVEIEPAAEIKIVGDKENKAENKISVGKRIDQLLNEGKMKEVLDKLHFSPEEIQLRRISNVLISDIHTIETNPDANATNNDTGPNVKKSTNFKNEKNNEVTIENNNTDGTSTLYTTDECDTINCSYKALDLVASKNTDIESSKTTYPTFLENESLISDLEKYDKQNAYPEVVPEESFINGSELPEAKILKKNSEQQEKKVTSIEPELSKSLIENRPQEEPFVFVDDISSFPPPVLEETYPVLDENVIPCEEFLEPSAPELPIEIIQTVELMGSFDDAVASNNLPEEHHFVNDNMEEINRTIQNGIEDFDDQLNGDREHPSNDEFKLKLSGLNLDNSIKGSAKLSNISS